MSAFSVHSLHIPVAIKTQLHSTIPLIRGNISKFKLFTALSPSPLTESISTSNLPWDKSEVETGSEKFDWYSQWYPLMPICDLDKRAPHAKKVMGIDVVLWWDRNEGEWKVFDDACPHRLAPLSEGRIDQWGRLQCVYHGWCFNGSGDCKFIPQAPRDGPPIHTSKKACVAAYPSTVQNDILWFWPNTDPQYKDIITMKTPPIIPELDDPSYTSLMGNRDIAYGYEVLIENLMDPAHLPYSHYGLLNTPKPKEKLDREGGTPLEASIEKLDVNGFTANRGWTWSESKFMSPSIFYAYSDPKEAASSVENKKSSVQKRFVMIFICIPVSPGNSRLIWCFPRNFGLWINKIVPRWMFHVGDNLVIDSDLYLLHVEEKKIMDVGQENWHKECFVPTKADALVIAFRKWLNKYAGGQVDWRGKYSGALPPTPPREHLLDRYWSHVVNCKSCNLAYKSLNVVEVALQIISVAAIGIVAAMKQGAVSAVTKNSMDSPLPSSNVADATPAVTEAVIEKSEEKIVNSSVAPGPISSDCQELLGTLNCSDPRVLIAIQRFNLRAFKSISFFEYQTPVNGAVSGDCDVSWRFRNKREKSWRKYRDFRRFRVTVTDDCHYKVIHAGGFHSGVNARRNPAPPRTPRTGGGGKGKTTLPRNSNRDDQINDTIPTLGSETNFRNGKYLYYSRGGDYCKGMNHYMWSFLCGLGEAMYLNRTFVMDLSLCLSSMYNPSNKDEEGKDFRYYFDFEHLKEVASIVEEGEFLRDWKRWDKTHLKKKKVPVRKVVTHKVTPMQLQKDKSTIIWRQFDSPEPENYWYRVCEGQAAKHIQRPWHALWKSKRLMNIVTEISGRMDWDFDAVHVVRGEKAQNKELWPNLDSDTSPDALVDKLKGIVQPWRNLYVATNEPYYNYFDKLRSNFKVHLLDDYTELWGNSSEWYNETSLLNNGKPVEFDGYMRVAVDTEVFYRGKTRVETFYNLTKDCKDGVNTC
ncbi:hypothetical protein P8452_39204 [Trifolium repens]|nr:hypothetical protein P8452_39204 [Trifolium repens]